MGAVSGSSSLHKLPWRCTQDGCYKDQKAFLHELAFALDSFFSRHLTRHEFYGTRRLMWLFTGRDCQSVSFDVTQGRSELMPGRMTGRDAKASKESLARGTAGMLDALSGVFSRPEPRGCGCAQSTAGPCSNSTGRAASRKTVEAATSKQISAVRKHLDAVHGSLGVEEEGHSKCSTELETKTFLLSKQLRSKGSGTSLAARVAIRHTSAGAAFLQLDPAVSRLW